ncbi:hypothetical protein P8C59_005900 [Phyllachora maydis]|uniref:Uncharacterized protein n=1 Tax=Phyllachora maydis TaxID=1825666 RepID=A0AAD9MEZ0_9PEZI|nr:hypothetical protein P8C59_005900 [Phyllachora maydis]
MSIRIRGRLRLNSVRVQGGGGGTAVWWFARATKVKTCPLESAFRHYGAMTLQALGAIRPTTSVGCMNGLERGVLFAHTSRAYEVVY